MTTSTRTTVHNSGWPAAPDAAVVPAPTPQTAVKDREHCLYQLEHFAAILEAVQLQILAGDNRVAAQNLAKLRAILEHRAGRYALVRVDRQPGDLAAFRRGLATKAHWSKRDQLLPGGL